MEAGLRGCSSEEVGAQLSRILATDGFRRSPSLGRFLTYLVDRALAGDAQSIKEYRLGLDVFDRGEDFDPRDDTIVRVQARNLRARLAEHYENPATADTIRFVIPKGAYVVNFEPIEVPAAAVSETRAPSARSQVELPRKKKAVAVAVLVVIAAGTFFVVRNAPTDAARVASVDTTLLVAPFANLSADKDNEYFAGGLTEELIDALANLPGLRVVARNSSPRWTDKQLDFDNLRRLGVDHVVEGSVRKEGSRVRIAVRLVDASNGNHLWSHEYDREIQDAIVTEQEIASAVAATLKLRFTGGVPAASIRTPDPDAYELYLKGRYSWRQVDATSAERGITYLERSLSLDPSFAPAYVALAGCYATRVIYYRIPAVEGYAKDREMALRALQLDDTLAEAHTMLAGVYAWNDWNWERSELEFRRGVQLAPQSVMAHQYFASFLGALGRQSEAEELMRVAMHLDPLDSLLQYGEGQLMLWRGDYREAEALLTKAMKRDPEFGLTAKLFAEVEWALGKDQQAETILRAHLARSPSDPIPLGELGYTLAKLGRAHEAQDILKQLEDRSLQSPIPHQALAFVYLGLGDNRKAIDELWKAADARTIRVPWLRVEPVYAPLRNNPRWADLLRHVNLEAQ